MTLPRHGENLQWHYERVWKRQPCVRRWQRGPIHELPADFCIAEFAPATERNCWTYATCGMSQPGEEAPLELHLHAPCQEESLVELLTFVAHFHRTGATLGVGHTVNLGRPWLPASTCSYGLLSLPYLDGPTLEYLRLPSLSTPVRCLWLLPITEAERDFKKAHGLEALEERFESESVNYLDPSRASVV